MAVSINRRLNLVIPVSTDSGTAFLHSQPISRETFERYWKVLARTHAAFFSQGLGIVSGPSVAVLMLKDVAEEMGVWGGSDGVQNGLLNEMRRLTNLIVPGQDPIPLANAAGKVSDEDLRDAEGALVFFTCVSAVNKRNQVQGMIEAAGRLWDFRPELSTATELAGSLRISTEAASSGVTAST